MTVYSPEQVASVTDPDARRLLTEQGLPDTHVTSFRPLHDPRPLADDPRYLVFGMWDLDRVPIGLDLVDGEVVSVAPRRPEVYQVNTSMRRFVESLDAIQAATPLSPRNPAYDSYDAAAEHVRGVLTRIDPEALADEAGFWQTIVDDIANGDYEES